MIKLYLYYQWFNPSRLLCSSAATRMCYFSSHHRYRIGSSYLKFPTWRWLSISAQWRVTWNMEVPTSILFGTRLFQSWHVSSIRRKLRRNTFPGQWWRSVFGSIWRPRVTFTFLAFSFRFSVIDALKQCLLKSEIYTKWSKRFSHYFFTHNLRARLNFSNS